MHEWPIDYSRLEHKDNRALRERFDECVRSHLDNSLCDPDNASAGLALGPRRYTNVSDESKMNRIR